MPWRGPGVKKGYGPPPPCCCDPVPSCLPVRHDSRPDEKPTAVPADRRHGPGGGKASQPPTSAHLEALFAPRNQTDSVDALDIPPSRTLSRGGVPARAEGKGGVRSDGCPCRNPARHPTAVGRHDVSWKPDAPGCEVERGCMHVCVSTKSPMDASTSPAPPRQTRRRWDKRRPPSDPQPCEPIAQGTKSPDRDPPSLGDGAAIPPRGSRDRGGEWPSDDLTSALASLASPTMANSRRARPLLGQFGGQESATRLGIPRLPGQTGEWRGAVTGNCGHGDGVSGISIGSKVTSGGCHMETGNGTSSIAEGGSESFR
ncbi:hypothetical protein JHW43_004161 [Diplocarpon mali]|nr:hypothetical protein JHW43_004161 [Diplocarpon mali]